MSKYKTIPKRDVFLERLMKDISDEHKEAVDLLLDCNEWYSNEHGKDLLTASQLQTITVFLHRRYTKTQGWVEAEIDEYNNLINSGATIV